jgi:hypothetical protein
MVASVNNAVPVWSGGGSLALLEVPFPPAEGGTLDWL